ncbi:hypothetical protein KAR91_59860 [Candidatus Pacearchaeota archaeon]|nr:hypothetical protein [Candidatus Pacearchaeota archaeon]
MQPQQIGQQPTLLKLLAQVETELIWLAVEVAVLVLGLSLKFQISHYQEQSLIKLAQWVLL